MITKGTYLNYMSCGLAHELVACFYNFCGMEKNAKELATNGYNFQYSCFHSVANVTSQVVTCFPTLWPIYIAE